MDPIGKVWHTGIVVFNTEYSYSCDGVSVGRPAKFRDPDKVHIQGQTNRSKEELEEYVRSLGEQLWTADTYDILYHNCQKFSQVLVEYLDVDDIPRDITAALDVLRRMDKPHIGLPLSRVLYLMGFGSMSGSIFSILKSEGKGL